MACLVSGASLVSDLLTFLYLIIYKQVRHLKVNLSFLFWFKRFLMPSSKESISFISPVSYASKTFKGFKENQMKADNTSHKVQDTLVACHMRVYQGGHFRQW